MGPIRTGSSGKQQPKNSGTLRRSNTGSFHGHGKQRSSSDIELPGVQKLKSALRQTKRLLAKDNLSADVRVKTDRRLKSLEADLEASESRRKERTLATRYHKVKFFERKKVLRKISQVKNDLEAASENRSASAKEAATQLENTLFELRVDLNYILHFPKLEKYISLFPSSDSKSNESRNSDDGENNAGSTSINETDSRRAQLRAFVRSQMEAGELGCEPELDIELRSKEESVGHPGTSLTIASVGMDRTKLKTMSLKQTKDQKSRKQGKEKLKETKSKPDHTVIDDFFAVGSDED